jgi:hypothetical protein
VNDKGRVLKKAVAIYFEIPCQYFHGGIQQYDESFVRIEDL